MLNFKYLPLAAALLACGSVAMAQEQEDTSTKLVKLVFQKVYSLVQAGNTNAKIDTGIMVSLCAPGIMVHPMTNSQADLTYVWDLMDNAIASSPAYSPNGHRISAIYKNILDKKTLLPTKGLTKAQEQELSAALDYVNPDGKIMDAYYTAQDNYSTAADAVEAERWQNFAANGVLRVSSTTMNKMNRALDTWMTKGNRAKVEATLSKVTELTNYDPGTWWTEVTRQFRAGKVDDSYIVGFSPKPEHWTDPDGWFSLSFNSSESTNSSSLDKKAVEASLSIDRKAFSASASGGWAKEVADKLGNSSSITIKFSAKRVFVQRKWINMLVFSNVLWTWNPTVQGDEMKVSDGKGGGLVPVVPVSFIIVKDVTIEVKLDSSFAKDFNEHIHAEAKASFCGISLSGSYASTVTTNTNGAKSEITTVTIPSPQILAVISNVVPPTPASIYAKK